jgi:hypothetical protein
VILPWKAAPKWTGPEMPTRCSCRARGMPAADDDNSVRRASQRFAARLPLFALLTNKGPAVSLLYPPAGERVYGWRANGFAATKIETGVMPGAPDAVSDYKPFSERPVVMAAVGSDGENIGPALYQQDLLVAHMSYELSI